MCLSVEAPVIDTQRRYQREDARTNRIAECTYLFERWMSFVARHRKLPIDVARRRGQRIIIRVGREAAHDDVGP